MTEEEKDRHIAYLERKSEIQEAFIKELRSLLDDREALFKELLALGQQQHALAERSEMINAEREGLEKKFTLQ